MTWHFVTRLRGHTRRISIISYRSRATKNTHKCIPRFFNVLRRVLCLGNGNASVSIAYLLFACISTRSIPFTAKRNAEKAYSKFESSPEYSLVERNHRLECRPLKGEIGQCIRNKKRKEMKVECASVERVPKVHRNARWRRASKRRETCHRHRHWHTGSQDSSLEHNEDIDITHERCQRDNGKYGKNGNMFSGVLMRTKSRKWFWQKRESEHAFDHQMDPFILIW